MRRPFRTLRSLAWRAFGLPGTMVVLLAAGAAGAGPQPAPPAPSPQQIGRMFRLGLLWTVVILIVLAVALIALRRFSFRYKQRLKRKRKQADTSDVWAQHRLPPDWDEDGDHLTEAPPDADGDL